jgi:hypothetical protein
VVFDLRGYRVSLNGFDALLRIRLRFVRLAGGADLAVRRFQVKVELAGSAARPEHRSGQLSKAPEC